MNNQDMQNQFQQMRQIAQQRGIGGKAYIDAYPASGFIRFKLKVASPEQRAEIISNFALALEIMSQGFNLETKKIINKEADNG
jgi:hypothetical protein